jgi:hypothetical protein
VVTRPEVAALGPSPLYWDKMLRRNPSTYDGLIYGVAGANIKKVQSDEAASPSVHRLAAPPREDRVTDVFMPQGRESVGRKK